MLKSQYQKVLKINFFSFLFIALLMLTFLALFLNSKGNTFYKYLNAKDVNESISKTIGNIKELQTKSTNDENFKSTFRKLTSFSEEIETYQEFLPNDELQGKIEKVSGELKSKVKNFKIEEKQLWKTYRNSVYSLSKYFESNKWKNLTIISKRVHYRTFTKHNLKDNFLEILSANLKDFGSMKKVTASSSLATSTKNVILKRIDAIVFDTNKRLEVENKFTSFKGELIGFQGLVSKWATDTKGLKVETQNLKEFKFLGFKDIFYLTFITALGLIGFYFISRKTSQFLGNSFEKDTLLMIDKVMIKGDNSYLKGYNPQFQSAVSTLQNYVSKRMSFGHIFQSTLPFPCILLDGSLMVKWVNDPLTQNLKISKEEIKSKFKSWDQLSKFFEFNGNDPIIDSLNNKQSGIYKFKLQGHDEDKLYEIYVNPMTHENQEYVMLYF